MGKTKKKARRPKHAADSVLGLEKKIEDEPEISPVVKNLLEKLTSSEEEHRKCACTGIANLVTQPGSLMLFLSNDVVRLLGPLLLDESPSIQREALGALRNISVSGDEAAGVCETMVKQDVMTPVVALMQKYITASQGDAFHQDVRSIQILTEAAHLLWNLCLHMSFSESSEVAVKIFNQQSLHTVLMTVLRPNTFPQSLVLPVVQCLNTVTDGNTDLCTSLSKDLTTLVNLMDWPQNSHSDILVAMNLVGLLQNVTSCSDCDAQVLNHVLEKSVSLVSNALKIDITQELQKFLEDYRKVKAEDITSQPSTDTSEELEDCETADGNGQQEADMTEDGQTEDTKSKAKHMPVCNEQIRAESIVEDAHDLVKAQTLAVTLISNFCCSQDEDSWEDIGSSDGSVEDVSMETESEVTASSNADISVDLLQLFHRHDLPSHVMTKCQPMDQNLLIQLASDRDTHSLLKSVKQVQVCSLVCLSNLLTVSGLVSTQQTDTCDGILGSDGVQFLQSAWQLLGPLLSTCRKSDNELLEAETLALRAVLERLGKADINMLQQAGETDLQFLCELTQQCENDYTRANLIRVVACIGCALAKQTKPHPHLKGIGEFFCSLCLGERELWVVAECLDCIFDVFGEDHLNPLLKEINLIEKLQQMVPVLKAKVKQQKQELGEHAAIVSTARTNLTRFIQYKLPLVT